MASIPRRKLLLSQWASVNFCMKCRPQFGHSLPERRVPDNALNKCSYSGTSLPVPVVQKSYLNFQRFYSSKTPKNSSIVSAVASTMTVPEGVSTPATTTESSTGVIPKPEPEPVKPAIPVFSGFDIREVDESTRVKVHGKSAEVATAQSYSLINSRNIRRRKEILVMDESDWNQTWVLKNRPPLLDRRAENENHFFRNFAPEKRNNADWMCFIQADIDVRPKSLKRWMAKVDRLTEIQEQMIKPKRTAILGNDLSAAHFLVFRKGKVKFLGQNHWISSYRKDAKADVPEEDLPAMKFELCSLPTKYDPKYRLEAIDAQGVTLYYEGLANFENLDYVKWINLRESPEIDDWCLDRIARMFNETLEYIDVSGCKKVTDKGIGTLHRCRKLKAIRAENMPHLENLEIVSAMLEDHLPDLQVLGIDYKGKMEQLRLEEEELKQKAMLEASSEQKLLTDSTNRSAADNVESSSAESLVIK